MTQYYKYMDGVKGGFKWASSKRDRWGKAICKTLKSHGYNFVFCCGWPGSLDIMAYNQENKVLLIGTIWIMEKDGEECVYKAEISLFYTDDPSLMADSPDEHIMAEVKGCNADKFVIKGCKCLKIYELNNVLSDVLSRVTLSPKDSQVAHYLDVRVMVYFFLSFPRLLYDPIVKLLLAILIALAPTSG